jgi:hypothetical protein
MQDRHPRADRCYCNKTVICRPRCHTGPPTASVQVSGIASLQTHISRDEDWQLTEYAIPTSEALGTIRSLQHFLQNWWGYPYWITPLECGYKKAYLGRASTAQERNPH